MKVYQIEKIIARTASTLKNLEAIFVILIQSYLKENIGYWNCMDCMNFISHSLKCDVKITIVKFILQGSQLGVFPI